MLFGRKFILFTFIIVSTALTVYFLDGRFSTEKLDTNIPISIVKSGSTTIPDSVKPKDNPVGLTQVTNSASGKTVFKMPNLEWKERYVKLSDGRTLRYQFGKGNPREVALSKSDIKKINISEKGVVPEFYSFGFCDSETMELYYLSPDVEKYLKKALSDRHWIDLARKCEKSFRAIESPGDVANDIENNLQAPFSQLYFDLVFSSGFLDMNHFISVDSQTGWKKLNLPLTTNLVRYLVLATEDGRSEADGWLNPFGDCVDRYSKDIMRNLMIANYLYRAATATGVPNELISSKNFVFPFHYH